MALCNLPYRPDLKLWKRKTSSTFTVAAAAADAATAILSTERNPENAGQSERVSSFLLTLSTD